MREKEDLKGKEDTQIDWKILTCEQVEQAADELLRNLNSEHRIYTEKQLARKTRLERMKLPDLDDTTMPTEAAEYLLRGQIELMVQSARLSKFQGAVLTLALEGQTMQEIATSSKIPYHTIARTIRIARSRVAKVHSPYDGLYEVYWHEVHRYVYRK
jgi:hypothetical protein